MDNNNFQSLNQQFTTRYGSGSVTGDIYNAQIAVGKTYATFPIGVATKEQGFNDGVSEGLMGLAYNGISQIAKVTNKNANFMDAAFGNTQDCVVSFHLSQDVNNKGQVTFGGVDTSKFVGEMLFVPLNSKSFWQFDFSDARFSVNGVTGNLAGSFQNAIADTGTTLMIIDPTAADSINTQINARFDKKQGVALFDDCKKAMQGPNIKMSFQGINFELEPASYVVRQKSGLCFSGIVGSKSKQGGGQAILGDTFLKQYYSAFDKANHRIGFALASGTMGTPFNSVSRSSSNYYNNVVLVNAQKAAKQKSSASPQAINFNVYIAMSLMVSSLFVSL